MRVVVTRLMLIAIAATTVVAPIESIHAEVVKVFFLVGPRMEGYGKPSHIDTYREHPSIKPTYARLKDGDVWRVRDDVWITYPTTSKGDPKHGPLTVGYGNNRDNTNLIGPEFGFGHAVGNAIDDNVVLIKISFTDGRTRRLSVSLRPPGSPPLQAELDAMLEQKRNQYANKTMYEFLKQDDMRPPKAAMDAMKESIRKWTAGMTIEDVRPRFGSLYRELIHIAKQELGQMDQKFPLLKGQKVEIAGFIWHHRISSRHDFVKLMPQFIRDVRKDLAAPDMPFVIVGHSLEAIRIRGIRRQSDLQVIQDAFAKIPAFKGTVTFVPTAEYDDTTAEWMKKRGYWNGNKEQRAKWEAVGNIQDRRYFGSGKTYYLQGVAFGEAILALQQNN